MPELKTKKGGRPRKYKNVEEAKAAATSRRKRARQKQQSEDPLIAEPSHLSIQLDPLSILNQVGPEGEGQITAAARGIQADGLDIPLDEEQEHFQEVFTFVFIYYLLIIDSTILSRGWK